MIKHRCRQCHKYFETNTVTSKFCSRSCKHANARIIKRPVVCAECKKSFYTPIRKNTSGKVRTQSFCSIECRRRFTLSNRKSYDCLTCGKHVILKKRDSNANKFCSKACASYYASVNTTLVDPNLSMHNLRYKYKAFVFYGFKCMQCGWDKDPTLLCVHHKDGKRKGNDVNNLEVLCPICHAKEHYKGGPTWQKQFKAVNKIRDLYLNNDFFKTLFTKITGHKIKDLP